MNEKEARKLAIEALATVEIGDPSPVADCTVVFKNDDGTFSVCDNGEDVECENEEEVVRIVIENLCGEIN